MAIRLDRRAFDADVHDPTEVREALMTLVQTEVRLRGEPHPRLYLTREGCIDALDLNALSTREPDAHVGATVQIARQQVGVIEAWLVVQLLAEDHDGVQHRFALLGCLDPAGVWWMAGYESDPRTGIGVLGDWHVPDRRIVERAAILDEILAVPPGAKPADLLAARKPELDLRAAFFEIPEGIATPTDAGTCADAAARIAVPDLLSGALTGTVVVKIAERSGEMWVIGEYAGDGDDLIRAIASREPAPDAIAIAMLALFEGSDPPQKGVQIVAEYGDQRAERWLLLDFPGGASAPPIVVRAVERRLTVDEGDGWIGVEPTTPIDLFPVGAGEA